MSENEEKFVCSFCEKIFFVRREYNKHVMSHKKTLKCEFCSKSFSRVKCRAKHYYEMHRDAKLKCDSCDIMYHKIRDMETHTKFHAKENPYLCLLCLKCFPSLTLLREHLHMHEKEARKLVNVQKLFDNDSNEINTDVKEVSSASLQTGSLKPSSNYRAEGYMCDSCGKVFRFQRSLRKHSYIHEPKGTYNCDLCDRTFEFKFKLADHMSYHKNRNPKSKEKKSKPAVKVRPLCHTCGRSFCDDRQLRRHREYHLPLGHFPCKLCDKVFDLNIKLKFHMIHHRRKARGLTSTGKPGTFPCEVCGKIFFYSSNLNTHRQIHRDSYSCSLCGKIFNKKWNLKTHMAIHLGDKPYSCSYCGASYADRSNLKKHLMKHPSDVEAKPIVTIKSPLDIPTNSLGSI